MNYNLSITGDCQNTNSGAIYIEPYNANSPYNIQWDEPSLGTDIDVTASTRTNLSAGTYVVLITDSAQPSNVILTSIPVSSGVCCNILGVQGTTCSQDNGSVTGTSSSNYSSTNFYLYSSGGQNIDSLNTNSSIAIFNGLSAGTYYMVAEDLGGCTGQSQNFIIEDSEPFTFGLYTVPNSSCGGTPIGKVIVTGQTGLSPYTYLWNNGETTSSITGLSAGNYSVLVTDSLGCSVSQGTTVTNVDVLGFGVFTATQPTCFSSDGVLTLQITGGTAPYYYSASTGNINVDFNKSWTLYNLSPGTYTISVTDSAFCNIIVSTTLIPPLGLASVTTSSQGSTCSSTNGSITVSVVGGVTPYTYTLIRPGGNMSNVSSTDTSFKFNGLSSGTYTVMVQDDSNCSFSQVIALVATDTYTISTQTTGTTCNQNNGVIKVTKTNGGTAPYDYSLDGVTYFLDNPSDNATFTNVSSGQHTVSVIDADGCEQTKQVYIEESEPLRFTLYATSCGEGSDGSLTTLISSGIPPFTFNWSNNVPNNPQEIEVYGLSAGTYSVTVTDSNGCTLERTQSIDCDAAYVSYQTYVMGGEEFTLQTQTKFGLLQMLNEGFNDLTSGMVDCRLLSAIFGIKISVNPSGFTTSENFYTGTTLTSIPSDNLYYNTLKDLLLTVPGVGGVEINPINNQIKINTIPGDETLNGEEIIVEVVIVYDIMCLSCQLPSPTPTKTPTPTPTLTPTPTPTLTPTPTTTNSGPNVFTWQTYGISTSGLGCLQLVNPVSVVYSSSNIMSLGLQLYYDVNLSNPVIVTSINSDSVFGINGVRYTIITDLNGNIISFTQC